MNNKKVITLDSSQLTTFNECPTMWNYGSVNRLVPKPIENNFPKDEEKMDSKAAGSYGHKVLEFYYDGIKNGVEQYTAFNDAIDIFHKDWDQTEEELSKLHDVVTTLGGDNIAIINKRLQEYTWFYTKDFNPEALEVGFSKVIYEDAERVYILEGRIDFLGTSCDGGTPLFMDHKLQFKRSSLYTGSIQFRNYALATELEFGIVNYIRMAKNPDRNTFVRAPISYSKLQMDAWRRELLGSFRLVEQYQDFLTLGIADEEGKYKRRSSCPGRFNYPCPYITLCDEPIAELVQIKIKQSFEVKEEWRPW